MSVELSISKEIIEQDWSNVTKDTLNLVSKEISDRFNNMIIGPNTKNICIGMFKDKLERRLLKGTIEYEVNVAIDYGFSHVVNVLKENPKLY